MGRTTERAAPWLAAVSVWLAGCQVLSGLSKLETNEGGGGAGGATVTTVATTDATTASTASSSSTAQSSSASSSSGTGGAPAELVPCGSVTDNFNNGVAQGIWAATNGAQGVNGRVRFNVVAGQTAALHLSNPATYAECYASVRLLQAGNQAITFLEVAGLPTLSNRERLQFRSNQALVSSEKYPALNAMGFASELGIALHGAQVFFLYKSLGGSWVKLGAVPRDAWMDAVNGSTIGFGAVGTNGSELVNLDDFNVDPIVLADLN